VLHLSDAPATGTTGTAGAGGNVALRLLSIGTAEKD
jgi:hypothetical protein